MRYNIDFAKILNYHHVTILGIKYAPAHQISLKSDDPRLGYRENHFQNGDVRHIWFAMASSYCIILRS